MVKEDVCQRFCDSFYSAGGLSLTIVPFSFLLLLFLIFFSFVMMGKAIVIRLEVVCRDAYMKNVIILDPYVPQALSYSFV